MSEPEAGTDRLDIDNMYLCGSRFTRVSLKDSFVADTQMPGIRFEDVNGTGLAFDNANLAQASFHNVNMSGATIRAANLRGLVIEHADIEDMTINGIRVTDMLAAFEKQEKDGKTNSD